MEIFVVKFLLFTTICQSVYPNIHHVHHGKSVSNHSSSFSYDNVTVDNIVRTWRGDGHWLIFLLRSIERFVNTHFFDSAGRVYVLKQTFDAVPADRLFWKTSAEYLLKQKVNYQTMTRMPIVYPRELYIKVLEHIRNHHNKPPLEVMQSRVRVGEFTTLGAYLLDFMHDKWVDIPVEIQNIVSQSWSWGGLGPETAAFYECVLRAAHRDMCRNAFKFINTIIA